MPNDLRPGDGDDAAVHATHPGNERAVIEADDNFRAHRHLAAATHDLPNEVRLLQIARACNR